MSEGSARAVDLSNKLAAALGPRDLDATLQDMRGDAAQTAGYVGAGTELLKGAKGLDWKTLLE